MAETAKQFRNIIGGKAVDSASGETYDIVNPATGEKYATAPASGAEDVDRAMKAAEEAFETWGETTPGERQLALLKIADALESRADEFVQAECENTGKPIQLTAEEELPPSVDELRFFAGAARVLEGRSAGEYMKGYTSMVRREPIGVIGQVTPWNYPLMMMIWKIAPALAAGNTVVLKPSDTTPATTTMFAEMAQEFLPPGVFNVICGDRDTGRAIVDHPTPEMVSITGSVRAGSEVAQSAGTKLKRTHLELGGKAPVVIFDDADLEAAAEAIATAGYFNGGQDCTAATRVLAAPGVDIATGSGAVTGTSASAAIVAGAAALAALGVAYLLTGPITRLDDDFRSAVAALLPLLVGGLTIVISLLFLRAINEAVDISIFALNLATGLGLGLAIDYSLFMVSRYREELQRVGPGAEAIRATVMTAGRTRPGPPRATAGTTTATVLPGPAWAASAANQPVPSTSEAASSDGMRSAAG